MKFTCEITIDQPVNRVVELFDNIENMHKWMEGLQKIEPLSGTPGQPGATSRFYFQWGKRKTEMTETIEVRNLPAEFTGTYDAGEARSRVKNSFIAINEQQTRFISLITFELKGLMKVMGWLMPGAFKKQSMKHLENFKRFAETTK